MIRAMKMTRALLCLGVLVSIQSKLMTRLSQRHFNKMLVNLINLIGVEYSCGPGVDANSRCVSSCPITKRTTCYRHEVSVQDQVKSQWIHLEVQCATGGECFQERVWCRLDRHILTRRQVLHAAHCCCASEVFRMAHGST